MRLDRLEDIGMLSLDETPVFDHVVQAARSLMDCKISLITLIDELNDRQFFKAATGLSHPLSTQRETPLSYSFCKTVVAHGAPLAIDDARLDSRFENHPATQDFGIVSYLGVPIIDDNGVPFGAVCVLDTERRAWTSTDIGILQALGDGVSVQVKHMLDSRQTELSEILEGDMNLEAFISFDNRPGAVFSYFQGFDGVDLIDSVSEECEEVWEISGASLKENFGDIFAMCLPEDFINVRRAVGNSAARMTQWQHDWRIMTPSGAVKRVRGYGQPEIFPGRGIRWNAIVREMSA